MQISGINKFSMLDFPGKIACVIFTPGCNLRCSFCHNPEFVLPELLKKNLNNIIYEKAFFKFLEKRKGLLDGISICGGEPTLQKDLFDFCKKIKDMGFLVKLDTNGRDPDILQKLIDEKFVDYIAMDIKRPFGKFEELLGVKESDENYKKSIQLLLKSNIDYEFRTTVIKGIHETCDIESICRSISGAKHYYLQNYRKGNTLKKDFAGESFSRNELDVFQNIAKNFIQKTGIRD